MSNQSIVSRKGKTVRHMLITVGKTSIPTLRERSLHEFKIQLDSCYAIIVAENIKQALQVFESNFKTSKINSIEIL